MSENNCHKCGELDIRIVHLEEDVKELKLEVKENSKFYDETLIFLRENLVKLTTIMERQDERLADMGNKIDSLEDDIKKSPSDNQNGDKKWYQKVILIFIMIFVIPFLLKLGMSPTDIVSILKGMFTFGG